MRKILLLSVLPLAILLSGGCASKKYVKQGSKYEQAGMWELASDAYLHSLAAKGGNIDALVGLKRSGQRVIDDKCYKMFKAYENDQLKDVVYGYLDAVELKNKAAAFGVELTISDITAEYFTDAKSRYIEMIYDESQQLMNAEKFTQAGNILREIQQIEPGYGDVKEMLKVSKCEPLYRQGKEYLAGGANRKAYANFELIISEYDGYKDSQELKEEALQRALITVKVDDFKRKAGKVEFTRQLQGTVVAQLNLLDNPFIKVVDTENTQKIIDEQLRSVNVGSNIQVGKILSARAILSGSVVEFNQSSGRLVKTEKRGYMKEVSKTKTSSGAEEKKSTYKKVIYYTYSVKNSVLATLEFQLTSTETGAVMVSDVVKESLEDETTYATFDGDDSKLIPGYWEQINKDSPKDVISDKSSDISDLKNLLKAKRDVMSVTQLADKAVLEMARKTAQKINQYNPEK
ncbi:MAG: hypothetical protein AB7S54_01055 [Bacteroidales bacterium]